MTCLIRSLEVEDLFEFLIKGDAEDEGEFGGGIELAGLDRADGVAVDLSKSESHET